MVEEREKDIVMEREQRGWKEKEESPLCLASSEQRPKSATAPRCSRRVSWCLGGIYSGVVEHFFS